MPKQNKPLRKWPIGIVVGVGLFLTIGLVAIVNWPPLNEVRTGETPEYPDLQPLLLRYSPELVLKRALETVVEMERWELARVERERGVVEAAAYSRLFGFVDDVTVRVEPYGAGSLVHLRSRSRVGRLDFGQNARNVRTFQAALRVNLQLARPSPR